VIARRAASDASCSEVRGFCTLVQLTPFGWRRAMTFDQQEPSANSPCTNTTFLVFGGVWALATRLSKGRTAPAATAPINVRRFIMASFRTTGDFATSWKKAISLQVRPAIIRVVLIAYRTFGAPKPSYVFQ
jgi:hypothetical protein